MRRFWIVPFLLLAACGKPPRDAATLLPDPVAGTWHRTSLQSTPPAKPALLREFQAAYAGPGKLTVDLSEAKVSGTAFEMTQHFRATPDTVFFDKGKYFVVVKWEQADRAALTAFVRALQKNLEE